MDLLLVLSNIRCFALSRGLGFAGELGASITLTSELLPKEKRGIAAANYSYKWSHGYLHCLPGSLTSATKTGDFVYFIGGAMGHSLLFLRVRVLEKQDVMIRCKTGESFS
jgi:MFS family permease